MLGVARPGIAPLDPAEAAAPLRTPSFASTQRIQPPPTPFSPPPVSVLPAPAPLVEMPAPVSARVVRKSGVPVATVALVAGGLLLGGGGAIAWVWRAAPAISAQPHASPTGEDVLHLKCDPRSCSDGTIVAIHDAKATFKAGETDLTLGEPLHVGDNLFSLRIDRPGFGRDEVLKLVVPVAFRIRADLGSMKAKPPSITVRVEAVAGSDVTVDGKRLPLDSHGLGAYAVDESAATEGTADESRIVSLDIPYAVIAGGGAKAAEKGTISARVVVAPLHVDAPGVRAVVDEDHILIAGRAAKGAVVTIDGAPAPVGAEGMFETNVRLPLLGERILEVQTETATLLPRTMHLSIRRVTSLADEGKAFEQRERTVGYDAAVRDIAANVGRSIVVEGEVIDSRRFGYGGVILVDDRRGCTKGPCLARVVFAQEAPFARGAAVRAYGRVARPFTVPNGQTVPEVDADFVIAAPKR